MSTHLAKPFIFLCVHTMTTAIGVKEVFGPVGTIDDRFIRKQDRRPLARRNGDIQHRTRAY